ncbi:Uncharacterised protein [uncultured archaeon]|nr:Uncharacterised protein [uncultured archaeon]
MNMKTIAAIAAILVVLGAGIAVARPVTTNDGFWSGMMGGIQNGIAGIMGNGMMGQGNGYAGMMGNRMNGKGSGNATTGFCSGFGASGVSNATTPITIGEAKGSVEKYLAANGNPDLAIGEVIEFSNNFYAGIKEKSTGKYAFELLVNKYTGAVVPEMGPNMMWNTKYGHMAWNAQENNSMTEKQAIDIAQKYLDTALPGTTVNSADAFYGYYTLEVNKDGKIYGMLSVNSNTGAVWYHNWHGTFVKIMEVG